jgi:hypothetical protein
LQARSWRVAFTNIINEMEFRLRIAWAAPHPYEDVVGSREMRGEA